MTSRLKHKLELENINTSSAYLNESFVQIGTPLPALAETRKDKLEYVPEWQQEVRDEKGRRRFHGAFTGGFSAGYFNSVGSKEGWTPATFKSSRSNRATATQRPEDFMDEEDLAAMKEDRKLENTETFRSDRIGSTKAEMEGKTLPSALQSLIEPARTSIGQKLLQKQGWRPGHGIGPRVTLRKLKLQEARLGKAARSAGENDDDDEMMDEDTQDKAGVKRTFAPRDSRLVVYDQKEDKAGLGYVGGSGGGIARSKPLEMRAYHVQAKDEDDDDPYAVAGPSTSSRPFAFSNLDADEDEDSIVIGGPSRSGASVSGRGEGLSRPGARGVLPADTGRWHDGRPVLSGFELDPLGVPADKWFEFPDIPPDWRPRPARVWGTTRRWDEAPGEVKEEKETIKGQPGNPLTFEQRGEALGEEQHLSKAKSIFEYMSEKERERLQAAIAAAKSTAVPPPPLQMTEEAPSADSGPAHTEVVIPPLSPRTAGAALRGFVPYGDDPAKQDRYRSYLSSQTHNTKTPNPVLRDGSIEEINKELESFAASARIFKPMSFAMSSRFTSGSSSLAASDMKQAKPGLHLYDAQKAAEAMAAAEAEKAKAKSAGSVGADLSKLTPKDRAAREGRYGKETRVIKEFYPTKLVCRRFGVQDPHPEGEPKGLDDGGSGSATPGGYDGGTLPKNDASWEDNFIHQPASDATAPATGPVAGGGEDGERAPRTLAEVGMADDINQGRDTLTYTKPSIDIFKAIFASDDESSDEEQEEQAPKKGNEQATASKGTSLNRPSTATANGNQPKRSTEDGKPADLATFKPVFALAKDQPDEAGKIGEKVPKDTVKRDKKRKKDKDKRKSVLSFHVEDEEGEATNGKDGEGRSGDGGDRRRRKMERVDAPESRSDTNGAIRGQGQVEEDMWVEKPSAVPAAAPRMTGRKGAADFM